MPRHILTKLTKLSKNLTLYEAKHKERILKAAREKQQVTHMGNPICLTAELSAETLQAEGNGRIYLKYGGNVQQRLLYRARISFKIDGETENLQTSES